MLVPVSGQHEAGLVRQAALDEVFAERRLDLRLAVAKLNGEADGRAVIRHPQLRHFAFGAAGIGGGRGEHHHFRAGRTAFGAVQEHTHLSSSRAAVRAGGRAPSRRGGPCRCRGSIGWTWMVLSWVGGYALRYRPPLSRGAPARGRLTSS